MGLFRTQPLLDNFSNSLIIFERSFILTLLMAYLDFMCFYDLKLVLIPREVINHFPDPPKLSFGSEDVILILSRLTNFKEVSKVMY